MIRLLRRLWWWLGETEAHTERVGMAWAMSRKRPRK